jgi:hypothetical protein
MTQAATRDVTATVDAYFAMWNEDDTAARTKSIIEAWAEEGRYSDPGRDATGYAALNEMVSVARPQFPGHTIRQSSGIDAHHEHVRFAWEVVGPDGSIPVAGIDIGVLAPDGRLRQITGFFGELPKE